MLFVVLVLCIKEKCFLFIYFCGFILDLSFLDSNHDIRVLHWSILASYNAS